MKGNNSTYRALLLAVIAFAFTLAPSLMGRDGEGHAQTVTPTFIGTGGKYSTAAFGSIEAAIGEPIVGTLSSGTLTLTQGFEQPFALIQIDTIYALANDSICIGSNATLSPQLSSASGSQSYTWAPTASLSCTNCSNPVATPTATTTYTLMVSDISGGDTGYVTIYVSDPNVLAGGINTICAGETTTLSVAGASGGFTPYTYVWANPVTSASSIIVSPSVSTNYTLALTDSIGCQTTTNYSVTVNPLPFPTITSSPSFIICQGSNTTLTASGGVSYVWSTSDITTSIDVSPTITTGYTVTATDGNGCTANASASVTVNNPPSLSITAPVSICRGSSTSLAVTITSGTGPYTYAWTPSGGATSSISVSPTITTAYSVAVTDGNSCTSVASTTVTVNPIPSFTAGPSSNSPVCEGENISLTAATDFGSTYSWSGPNSFTSTQQNPVITSATSAMAGSYSVNATSAAGCVSIVQTTFVTVNPPAATPTTSSNSPVCSGSTLSLTASSVSGTYSWSGPNSFTSTLKQPTITDVTTAESGTYSVQVTLNGCPGIPAVVSVTVNPLPAAPITGSNSPVCVGSDISLNATSDAGSSYFWEGPSGFTSSVQDPIIVGATGANDGTYTVTPTSVDGCVGPASTFSVSVITPTPLIPLSSNSPVCEGATLTLTAQPGFSSYSWSGPNAFTATVMNPGIAGVSTAASGTYSVSAIYAGCSVPTATISVIVNASPSIAPVASATICTGQSTTLTATASGGSPPYTFSWSPATGLSSTNISNPVANPTVTTTYSVFVTDGLGCISSTQTTTVTVNPLPTLTVSSNTPVCEGQNLSLSANSSLGGTYFWQGPNGFTSTQQNPVIASVSLAATGVYSVNATSAGCTSPFFTHSVSVNATPAAPAASVVVTPVCEGQPISLTAETIAGASYSWNGPAGFTSAVQNPVIGVSTTAHSGTYSVTVTVAGCTGPAGTTSVSVIPLPLAPTAGSNSPVCIGSTINLTASTVAGATYSWSGPNTFTSSTQNPTIGTATLLNDGTYSVSVTVSGCTSPVATTSVNVLAIPSPPTAGSNSPVCEGADLSLTASTVAGATYSWNGPNGFTSTVQNPVISSVSTAATGAYSVTATVSGCVSGAGTVTVSIIASPGTPAASAITNPVCEGADISLTASVIAGATYEWNGPNGFTSTAQNPIIPSVSTLASGTYSVTATLSGCTGPAGTTSVTVNPIPTVSINASPSTSICIGSDVTLSASGASGYVWSTGSSASTVVINVTSTSSYSVTGTTAGCSASQTISITGLLVPSTPSAGSSPASPICENTVLTLTASPVAPATYNWTGPNSFTSTSSSPSFTVTLADAGTYSVSAVENGCASPPAVVSISVTPAPATPSPSNSSPVCAGMDVTLNANTSGASYSWSGPNGFTSALQDPVLNSVTTAEAGTYTLSVSIGGCSSPDGYSTVVINSSPVAQINGVASYSIETCQGLGVNLNASGAPVGGSYFWTPSNGLSATNISNPVATPTVVGSHVYTVTVTGLGGCTGTATATVTVLSVPTAALAVTNATCFGTCDGSINASNVTGGSAPYTYNWSGPSGFSASTSIISSLCPGAYTLQISDTKGCTSTVSDTVKQPKRLIDSLINGGPVCLGGSATLDVQFNSGAGTTVTWQGPNIIGVSGSTAQVAPTTPTTYTVFVTSASGCKDTGFVPVNVVSPPVVTHSGNANVCSGQSTTLTATGGATYLWNPGGQTVSSISTGPLTATTIYTVTVSNAAGCTASDTIVVSVVQTPTASISVAPSATVCPGTPMTLSASGGGLAGLTYQWNMGATTPVITGLATTTNTFTVIVNNGGCKDTAIQQITVSTPAVSINATPGVICQGDQVTLTATGGTSYSWNSGQTDAQIIVSPTATTVYIVTGSSSAGCSAQDSVTITVNPPPVPGITVNNDTICLGTPILLTASGGNNYQWVGGPASATWNTTPSSAGSISYSVSVGTGNCSADTFITVQVNPLPNIITSVTPNVICPGDTATLIAGGALFYIWNIGQSTNTILVSPATTQTYLVTGFDANQCSDQQIVTVTVNDISVDAGKDQTICPGFTADLFATVGNAPGLVSYMWIPGYPLNDSLIHNPSANPDSTTTFWVVATSGNCSAQDSVTIYVERNASCLIHIYNGITPNGDGSNDIWYIDGIQSFPDNHVRIFNRWGTKVWDGKGYDNNEVVWRGQGSDESPLPDGTYYYIVEIFENGSVVLTQSDWVEVTR